MAIHDLSCRDPIVIFGIGGSGTRVVTEILQKAGCFFGWNLNHALDNQDFGFLLSGRVDWMMGNYPFNGTDAYPYLSIFKKVFFRQTISPVDYARLGKITLEYLRGKSRHSFGRRPLRERLARGRKLFAAILPISRPMRLFGYKQWGFKSPEAIYLIKPLIKYFPGAKIVHTIRDGRDMIYSKNTSRLQYLDLYRGPSQDPLEQQLQHWIHVNQWAADIAVSKFANNQYLQIKYEDLCLNPHRIIDQLLSFAQLPVDKKDRLYQIPRPNPDIGRWRKYRDELPSIYFEEMKAFGY